MERSKIGTYIGFCIRARKIAFGVDDAEKQRKGVYLLIADEELSPNSLKTMIKTQERLGCPLLISEKGKLAKLTNRPAVKAVSIKDEHLASAILSALESEPQFKCYSGGTK